MHLFTSVKTWLLNGVTCRVNMKNFVLTLTTKAEFDKQVNSLLSSNPSQPLYVNITKKAKKRSLSANAQQHVFYEQIAKYYGDRLALDVKNMCRTYLDCRYY